MGVSDTEMHSDIEGCETLAVAQERERDFAQPAPVNYDVEGFAPTIPEFDDCSKRILGVESGALSESDTDITLYGYQHTTTSGASGSESVLDAYWSPRTAQGHNMTWE